MCVLVHNPLVCIIVMGNSLCNEPRVPIIKRYVLVKEGRPRPHRSLSAHPPLCVHVNECYFSYIACWLYYARGVKRVRHAHSLRENREPLCLLWMCRQRHSFMPDFVLLGEGWRHECAKRASEQRRVVAALARGGSSIILRYVLLDWGTRDGRWWSR